MATYDAGGRATPYECSATRAIVPARTRLHVRTRVSGSGRRLAGTVHVAQQPGSSLGARPSAIISRLAVDTFTRCFPRPSLVLPMNARSKSI